MNEVSQDNKHQYTGVVGLNTKRDGFDKHVMSAGEVIELFSENKRFCAQYVYPLIPSDGFDKPVVFSGERTEAGDLILTAEIVSNTKPKTCPGWFASKVLLPKAYIMKDHLSFIEDNKDGFGPGSFTITSIACNYPQGGEAKLTKKILAVTDRPGLFLKIADGNGHFHENIAIFFPAQATGWTHKSVERGEAFVLVEEGLELDKYLVDDIERAFDFLIDKSYKDQGLYNLNTHRPITEDEAEPMFQMN